MRSLYFQAGLFFVKTKSSLATFRLTLISNRFIVMITSIEGKGFRSIGVMRNRKKDLFLKRGRFFIKFIYSPILQYFMSIKSTIAYHINPVRDMEKYLSGEQKYINFEFEKQTPREFFYTHGMWSFKPMIRGGIVGGTLGAIVAKLCGENPSIGFDAGAKLGAIVDFLQYNVRAGYNTFQEIKKSAP